MSDLISILIPHYSDVVGLRRALSSIAAQTDQGLEVVVADDGSPTLVLDELRGLEKGWNFPLRIIRLGINRGAAAARNAALEAAEGDIVCLLDSDDLFLPGKIAWVRKVFRNPQLRMIGHRYCDGERRQRDNRGSFVSVSAWPWWLIALKNPVVTPSVCFRKDVETRFDERFRRFDDQLFLLDFTRRHGPMRVDGFVGTEVPKPLIGAGGLSGSFSRMLTAEIAFISQVAKRGPLGVPVAALACGLLLPRIALRLCRLARTGDFASRRFYRSL